MNGADRFSNLFPESIQFGRLYLLPGHHARGKTFRLYILPDGTEIKERHAINPPRGVDAVEVYGIISGQPGWTESYGWLHKGPWQDDFMAIVANREATIKQQRKERAAALLDKRNKDNATAKCLLDSYK